MPQTIVQNLDELKTLVGKEVVVSDWFEVTQEQINSFAAVIGDFQWIHVDPIQSAQKSPFKSTIAHGFLIVSLIGYLSEKSLKLISQPRMSLNCGFNRVRFISPVLAGAKIRLRMNLKTTELKSDGGTQLIWSATVEGENPFQPHCIAELLSRVYI